MHSCAVRFCRTCCLFVCFPLQGFDWARAFKWKFIFYIDFEAVSAQQLENAMANLNGVLCVLVCVDVFVCVCLSCVCVAVYLCVCVLCACVVCLCLCVCANDCFCGRVSLWLHLCSVVIVVLLLLYFRVTVVCTLS
jgi:hypothetical protein